jgi:hypothetical protein
MAKTTDLPMKLRTREDLTEALEWLFNQQKDGKIDGKAGDGMNTTIKGLIYLNHKLPQELFKIFVQAQIKKIEIPVGLLPPELTNIPKPTESNATPNA